MASGFYAKLSGGPCDGAIRWFVDGTTEFKVCEAPQIPLIERGPSTPPAEMSVRTGWYQSTGPQTNDGYIFTWRGWLD
jgi:hypothetical protein